MEERSTNFEFLALCSVGFGRGLNEIVRFQPLVIKVKNRKKKQIMFCGIHIFALLNAVVFGTSEQLRLKNIGSGAGRGDKGSGGLCSEAGNCRCLFKELEVIVKCVSGGSKLHQIASKLPRTTTHL